eukprot:TRINITY_DN2988_c0_g2_i1.p1 TRINITY_DN2988_c0_g2~~TRINITY_DN2988_c0_g2_i1.p1  ORF type:complete len:433 (+),score=76.86 TRINITY_DN2988_c0_g2_i1:54-1301(+)
MNVQILRGESRKILFIECSSKFVDVLLKLKRAPLGEVIGAFSQESASDGVLPASALMESLSTLEAQRNVFKRLPEPEMRTDFATLIERHADNPPLPGTKVLGENNCEFRAVGNGIEVMSRGGAYDTNIAFDVGERKLFEMKVTFHDHGADHNVMVGIVPRDVNIQSASLHTTSAYCMQWCNREFILNGPGTCNQPFKLVPLGNVAYIKLIESYGELRLQFANENKEYFTAPFLVPISDGTYVPFVSFGVKGKRVTVEHVSADSEHEDLVKPDVQFLVTNRLEVFPNSNALALDLIAKLNGDSLKDITYEKGRIEAPQLQKILVAALLGREDILEMAFPPAPEEPAVEEPAVEEPAVEYNDGYLGEKETGNDYDNGNANVEDVNAHANGEDVNGYANGYDTGYANGSYDDSYSYAQ